MRWIDIIEDREPFIRGNSITFYSGKARCRLTIEGNAFYMSHVVTDEDSRGLGHASKAIQKALAYADAKGKAVTLVAMPDNDEDVPRLVSFYKRFGFEQDKPTPDCQLMTRPAMGN